MQRQDKLFRALEDGHAEMVQLGVKFVEDLNRDHAAFLRLAEEGNASMMQMQQRCLDAEQYDEEFEREIGLCREAFARAIDECNSRMASAAPIFLEYLGQESEGIVRLAQKAQARSSQPAQNPTGETGLEGEAFPGRVDDIRSRTAEALRRSRQRADEAQEAFRGAFEKLHLRMDEMGRQQSR